MRVRAYSKVGGSGSATVYSGWSAVKKNKSEIADNVNTGGEVEYISSSAVRPFKSTCLHYFLDISCSISILMCLVQHYKKRMNIKL